jgi:Na+-driven multidrug efflux pump
MGLFVGGLHGVLPHIFTSDPAVVALASGLLVIVALLQPLNGVVFALDGILIGAGDLGFLARAMVIALVVFVPAAIAVLVTGSGVAWLWGALGLLMLTRAITLIARWRGDGWAVTGSAR